MMYRLAALFVAATTLVSGPNPEPAVAHRDEPSFITILFGRSSWQATYVVPDSTVCRTPPGGRALTLEDAAAALAVRGLVATGGVVTSRTEETARECLLYTTQASWADLARLRDEYGWTFTSQGSQYLDMTTMTTDSERRAESVRTLPVFEAHGHSDAWGAFNYPNDKQDEAAQRVVTEGFAFGRKYNSRDFNTRETATAYPYPMRVMSVNGGSCSDTALLCSKLDVVNDRVTTSPWAVASRLSPVAGEWGAVQFYRFVRGRYGTMTGNSRFAWDCTASRWQARWTRQPELYCWNSFLTAIDHRSTTAVVASPADVARAWGRSPGLPVG